MYKNCCKKCGGLSLHTEVKGNNIGLYCDDCGAWIKWLSKDELRAFEHSQKEIQTVKMAGVVDSIGTYRKYELNLDKVNSIDDCKKVLKFLSDLTIKPLLDGIEYNGFSEVKEYYRR